MKTRLETESRISDGGNLVAEVKYDSSVSLRQIRFPFIDNALGLGAARAFAEEILRIVARAEEALEEGE